MIAFSLLEWGAVGGIICALCAVLAFSLKLRAVLRWAKRAFLRVWSWSSNEHTIGGVIWRYDRRGPEARNLRAHCRNCGVELETRLRLSDARSFFHCPKCRQPFDELDAPVLTERSRQEIEAKISESEK